MPLSRQDKAEQVEFMKGVLNDNEVVVVMHNLGLTVSAVTTLRNKMREAGGGVKVVKNNLAKIALKEVPGGDVDHLFKGPTVIAYSTDPVTAPKVLQDFVKTNDKLAILGGRMRDEVMDASGIEALSKLPSREEMIATIAAMIGAPASNVVGAIAAPGRNLAGIAKTLAEKEEA
jgi:large subunit ribosomal protein L10